jgi:vacuolar protein sorting-associated protein 13A/C
VKKPSARLAYRIAEHAKPKARENIAAELKLGCLSVSILDSSCGMVCRPAKLCLSIWNSKV